MHKKVLTEQSIYFGDVSMPEHWEIDRVELSHHILQSNLTNQELKFSKTWDRLDTYIRDFISLNYNIFVAKKQVWGNIYKPNETTIPLLNIDPVDLKNSPDFTMLYGVKVKDCFVKIYFDDNRRKGRSWDIELKDNMFIMFPSTNMYYLTNNQKNDLNFIQTVTYEYI